jgi:hypothetical protein
MRDNIATMFSNNTTTLAAFNLTPKKPRQPLSVEARAAATAKARATRIARGTESKKKAEVSGNVTGVTITPVTNPSASPSSPAGSSATASSGASAPAQGRAELPPAPRPPALRRRRAAAAARSFRRRSATRRRSVTAGASALARCAASQASPPGSHEPSGPGGSALSHFIHGITGARLVAGHAHGGWVQLPFLGPPIASRPSR